MSNLFQIPEDLHLIFSYRPPLESPELPEERTEIETSKSKNMSHQYAGAPIYRDDTVDAQLQRDGDFCLRVLQCTDDNIILVSPEFVLTDIFLTRMSR